MAVESLSSKDSWRLVFSEGSSNKFWKIELDGSSHTVTFRRVGTSGQTQTKDFGRDDAARKAYDKLVAEKTKKGLRRYGWYKHGVGIERGEGNGSGIENRSRNDADEDAG